MTSYYIFAAILLAFQHNYLFFCCYALDFQTLLPTTFLLLRSGVSNITYDCVSAARPLSFHHKLVLFMLVAARLLTFSHCFHYFLLIVATLLTFNHYFLLRSLAATLLAFQHNFPFVVASLLAFKYYFLVRSCCYALGFPT